jgi:hypothetical protein
VDKKFNQENEREGMWATQRKHNYGREGKIWKLLNDNVKRTQL